MATGFAGAAGIYGQQPWNPGFGREFYVCNRSGVTSSNSPGFGKTPKAPMSTISYALLRAQNSGISGASTASANDGTVIHVGPGHSESFTTASFWGTSLASNNITIVGHGVGDDQPVIKWTNNAATLLFNYSGFRLVGMRLELADSTATTTVAAPITVSKAGCGFIGCLILTGFTAARLCTTAITVAAGADDFMFANNTVHGLVAAASSDILLVKAAVKRTNILNNSIMAAVPTTEGVVSFTTAAALESVIKGNVLVNLTANSTVALLGMTGVTGVVDGNTLGIQNATGGATAISTPGNWNMAKNQGAVLGKEGIEITPQSG